MGFGSGGWGSTAWGSTNLTPQPFGGGSDILILPPRGPLEGGTQVRIVSAAILDMSACTPDWTDGVLDAGFWTLINTGTGSVAEVPLLGELRLDTGTTAGSVAGVRTSATEDDIDIEVSGVAIENTAPAGATSCVFELALIESADTSFRLIAEQSRGVSSVRAIVTVNGGVTFNQIISERTSGATLRLQRFGSRVFAFVAGQVRMDATWQPGTAQIELRAASDATFGGRIVSRIRNWTRRPVILFGSEPLRDIIVRRASLIEGSTPPQILPDVVDVVINGCQGAQGTEIDGFEYLLSPGIVVFNQSGATVTTVRDLILRGQV